MRETQPRAAGSQPAGKADPDMDDFSALYDQYMSRIFTYFQYRCGDSATAQDLTMQVFERLLRCLPRYDADQEPFAAWLFAIVRHVAADWQRQQYLRQFIPWEYFSHRSGGGPGPEDAALESEERRSLRSALAQLSPRQRDIIGLRFASELTNRAIAEVTGLSESNVAVILFRALGKLRQRMVEKNEVALQNPASLAEVEHE